MLGGSLAREPVKPASRGIARQRGVEARGVERLEPRAKACKVFAAQAGNRFFEVVNGHGLNIEPGPAQTKRPESIIPTTSSS